MVALFKNDPESPLTMPDGQLAILIAVGLAFGALVPGAASGAMYGALRSPQTFLALASPS